MIRTTIGRAFAAGALAVLALALSGCLLSPGKFTSRLELRSDRTFAYLYQGEIHLLALSKLAAMGQDQAADEFVPQPCYDEETFEERPCMDDEIVEQERAWKDSAAAGEKGRAQGAEMMRAMLGGIDPADPEAAAELAERLQRQKGWTKVVHKGDGLFEVRFEISGPLQHDFQFPTIERFAMANPFVQIALRGDGTVRMDAPGFAAQAAGGAFPGMMAGVVSEAGDDQGGDAPQLPELDGTFTLVTDGEILANNTDDGPLSTAAGQTLEWRINKRTRSAPMALVRLGR